MILRLLALGLVAIGTPASAQEQLQGETFARISRVIDQAQFSGDIALTDLPDGKARFAHHGALPQAWRGGDDGATWRWASITKQMLAILAMQQVEQGRLDLDATVSTYLPQFASANAATITVRQLLQHRSGLPNPDATVTDEGSFPAFYQTGYVGSRDPVTGYCAGPVTGEPGGDWSYNNCDFMVLGAVLEAVTGESWQALFASRIAEPLGLEFAAAYPGEAFTRIGSVDGEPEPAIDLASFGAAAGLFGSLEDLLKIDMALLDGRLLGPQARSEMWQGDPALGYMALGQWVFPASLAGCSQPVLVVERRGAIGGVHVRNFIFPERSMAMVAFSDSEPFDYGEIWTGAGFSHDLLSAALCPSPQGDSE